MSAPAILRLYHGTSTEGFEAARERGFLAPRDYRALVAEIGAEYDLDPEAIWSHPWFDYVRGSRSRCHDVFLTDRYDNASYYANCLNESTRDALRTAHRMLNQPLMAQVDLLPVVPGKALWAMHEQAFIDAWQARHAANRPLVLTFDLPLSALPVPEHVRDRFPDAAVWWVAATHDGDYKLNEISFPDRFSLDTLVDVAVPAAELAA